MSNGAMMTAERRSVLSLLREAQARYESLHISDDVFGEAESGGGSSDANPFYSTSDSSSEAPPCPGATPSSPGPGHRAPCPGSDGGEEHRGLFYCNPLAGDEDGDDVDTDEGWTSSLSDVSTPTFKGTCGERAASAVVLVVVSMVSVVARHSGICVHWRKSLGPSCLCHIRSHEPSIQTVKTQQVCPGWSSS